MEFVHKPFVAESDPSTSCNSMQHYIYTHTRTPPFNGPFSGTTRVSRYQKGKTNLDFTEAREWVAVASAGPYASLHLAPDRCQYPTTHVFYRPDALPAAQQQRQSTEGTCCNNILLQHYTDCIQTAGPYLIGLPFLAYYEWGWVTDSKKIQWLLEWDFLHTGSTFRWLANNVKVLIANDYTLLSVHTFGARSLRNSLASLALAVCIILRRWPS